MRTRPEPVSDPTTRIHYVDALDAGISLGILERRGPSSGRRLPPILLIHGATFGVTLFDLPIPGYSLIDELARSGRTVYALDIRGYGYSLSGGIMDAPPHAHPPFARLKDAIRDVEAAVAFILAREQMRAVDIVGFSWGTVVAACYAAQFPDRVTRLALYAPLYAEVNEMWRERIGDPNDRTRIDPKFGAYRLITLADVVQRWNGDIGSADHGARREDGLPEVIFDALAALDPESGSHAPAALADRRIGRPRERIQWHAAFRSGKAHNADLARARGERHDIDRFRFTTPVGCHCVARKDLPGDRAGLTFSLCGKEPGAII